MTLAVFRLLVLVRKFVRKHFFQEMSRKFFVIYSRGVFTNKNIQSCTITFTYIFQKVYRQCLFIQNQSIRTSFIHKQKSIATLAVNSSKLFLIRNNFLQIFRPTICESIFQFISIHSLFDGFVHRQSLFE